MKLLKFVEYIKESLPQQKSIDQLKMVRKISKGTDIGDRIADMNKQGANIQYIQNPIDTGIETYQDYMFNNKDFDMKNPLNNNKTPALNYVAPQTKAKYKKEKIAKPKDFKVNHLN